jgi:hypothetical protein
MQIATRIVAPKCVVCLFNEKEDEIFVKQKCRN